MANQLEDLQFVSVTRSVDEARPQYRSANDEDPFLLPARPLDHFVRTLRQCVSAGAWSRDTVQLKRRRDPGQ